MLVEEIPPILQPITASHVSHLEEVFLPGLTMISWKSMNLEKCENAWEIKQNSMNTVRHVMPHPCTWCHRHVERQATA